MTNGLKTCAKLTNFLISIILLSSCSTVKKSCPDAIGADCMMLSTVGRMTQEGVIDIYYSCKDGVCIKRTKDAIGAKEKELTKKLERSL